MKKYLYLCLAVVGIAVFASCKSQKAVVASFFFSAVFCGLPKGAGIFFREYMTASVGFLSFIVYA